MAGHKLQATKDYRLFTRSVDNRPLTPTKHKRLRHSMELYGFMAYHQVNMTQDEICNCLAEGYNFLVGIPVYMNFEQSTDGVVGMPSGEFLGGHDILIQGYDLKSYGEPMVYGQNHWASWGFEGHSFTGTCHFRMPMEYLTRLGSDAWTLTLT